MKRLILASALLFWLAGIAAVCAQHAPVSLKAAEHLLSLDDKKLDEPLSRLLEAQLYRSGDDYTRAQIWMMRGRLHEQRGRREDAFVAYFTSLYFDIEERHRGEIATLAKLAAEKSAQLSPIKEKLSVLVDQAAKPSDTLTAELAVLSVLRDLEYPKLYPQLMELAGEYAYRVPFAPEVPELWMLMSKMAQDLGLGWQALAAVTLVVDDYPQSDQALQAKLDLAALWADPLKKYDKAADCYVEILNTPADSGLFADARWQLALLYEEKEKTYSAAIERLDDFVAQHPVDARVPEAFMRKADMQIERLKEYDAGVETYKTLIAQHGQAEVIPEAKWLLARVYEKKLKDYIKAADQYAALARAHEDFEKSGEAMYLAGRLAQDKIKDVDLAMSCYQEVVDKFNKDVNVDDARNRIKKLEEEKAKAE